MKHNFKITFLFLFILFSGKSFSQDFPKNLVAGKCYEKCYEYDKKIEWKEADCNDLKKKNSCIKTKRDSIEAKKKKIKFIKYQEKLIKLGYNLSASECLDQKTIEAHHKYLRDKNRESKKRKRLQKKVLRKSSN